MNKCVLITGATSGIGEATVELLSRHGFRLILTGRRKDKLENLRTWLIMENKCEIYKLNFDIRKVQKVEEAIDLL